MTISLFKNNDYYNITAYSETSQIYSLTTEIAL